MKGAFYITLCVAILEFALLIFFAFNGLPARARRDVELIGLRENREIRMKYESSLEKYCFYQERMSATYADTLGHLMRATGLKNGAVADLLDSYQQRVKHGGIGGEVEGASWLTK